MEKERSASFSVRREILVRKEPAAAPGRQIAGSQGRSFSQSVDMTTILETKSVPDQVLVNVMSIPRIHRLP